MRTILHLDMDAFFAAVEMQRKPELAGKPVVIGGSGDPGRRGVVSTASYEARKFGIHSGMPLRTAYRLCPNALFLPVDYPEYSRVSHIFKDIMRSISPVFEDVGIDEAYLDLTEIDRPVQDICQELKTRIAEATGLTCSIGIAPNKLLAKLASDMQKPDGLTLIGDGDVEKRIWPLPVRKLIGVGPKTEAYLKRMGISTIGDLAAVPPDKMPDYFGESYGHYLYEASRGIDNSPLVTHWEPKSTSRETTFQKDVRDKRVLAGVVLRLIREIETDLKDRGYRGRTVTVKLRYSDFETRTRVKTLPQATGSFEEMKQAAYDCLRRFEFIKPIRLVGIRLGELEPAEAEPEDFSAGRDS